MKKRLLSLVLCLVMVFSLLPFAGFAAQEPDTNNGATIVNPDTAYSTRRDLNLSKTLTANDDGTFDLQLESYATGKVTTKVVTHQTPTDFIFVVDQSGSMSYKDMPLGYEAVMNKTTWRMSDIPASDSSSGSTDGAYYYKDPNTGDYYRVYKKWGAMYELVERNSLYLQELIDRSSLSWFRDAGEQTQSFDSMYYYQPSADPLIAHSLNPDKDLANDHHFYPLKMEVENAPLYYYMTFSYKDINNTPRTMKYYYNRYTLDAPRTNGVPYAESNSIIYYNSVSNGGIFGPGQSFALSYENINRLVVYAAGEGVSPASAIANSIFGGWPDEGFYYRYTYAQALGMNTGMYVQNPIFIGHVGYHQLCYRDANGEEHYLINTDYCDENEVPLGALRGSEATWNGTLYRVAGTANGAPQTESRLQALNTSLKTFVDEVAGQTDSDGNVRHRIAIVGFSSDGNYNNNEILTGVTLTHGSAGSMSTTPNNTSGYSLDGRTHNGTAYSNSISQDTYYGALVDTATAERTLDQEKVTSLKHSVDAITAHGGTQPEIGFAMAQKIIEARNAKDPTASSRNTVVIFFTDGRPGNYSTDNQYVEAGQVVLAAKGVKDLGATVYSVGVFNEADGNPLTYDVQSKLYTLDAITSIRNRACDNNSFLHNHVLGNGHLGDAYSVYQVQQRLFRDGYELEQKSSNGKYVQEYRTNFVRKDTGYSRSYNTGTWSWSNNHYADNVFLNYNEVNFYYRDCVESTFGYPEHPNDTIADYMTTVSSTYKTATSFDGDWSRNPGSNYTNTINSARGSKDAHNYYMLATNAERLEEVFVTISQDVDISGTTVNLNDKAELQDVINSDAFVVPANSQVEVWTQPMKATDNGDYISYEPDDNATKNTALTNAVIVDADGTVHVSGFNYETHYVMPNPPAETTPMKLIVKIKGLVPTDDALNSAEPVASNDRAGIYAGDNTSVSTVASVEVESPTFTVTGGSEKTYIIDFGAEMIVANNAKQVKQLDRADGKSNGTFNLKGEQAVYQLKSKDAENKFNVSFSGVDNAMVFGVPAGTTGDRSWNKITTVPANNIYFDDQLGTLTATENNSGRNTGVTNASSVGDGAVLTNGTYENPITFTVTGSRVDIYCTTESTSGTVIAQVWQGDTLVKSLNTVMSNRFDGEQNGEKFALYNVPTLSFDLPDSTNAYTVKITTNGTSNYKIDGVRVYKAVDEANTDVKSAYLAANEANSFFLKVRDQLLAGARIDLINAYLEAKRQYDNAEDKTGMTEPVAPDESELRGVMFYMDSVSENDGTNLKKTAEYSKMGPKNEIYLAKNEGLSFAIMNAPTDMKVWIGLSAPQGTASGSVKINGAAYEPAISNAVDMYYPVSVKAGNVIEIQNVGDALISVTNVKITGSALNGTPGATVLSVADVESAASVLSAEDGLPYLAVTPKLLAELNAPEQAEDPQPTADPEPTPTQPGIAEWISNLFSIFVNALFGSIARLFGN